MCGALAQTAKGIEVPSGTETYVVCVAFLHSASFRREWRRGHSTPLVETTVGYGACTERCDHPVDDALAEQRLTRMPYVASKYAVTSLRPDTSGLSPFDSLFPC